MDGCDVVQVEQRSVGRTGEGRTGRIIIDLSDYVRFMVRAGTVSGIQRVIAAIANEGADPERVLFCLRAKNAYWQIPYANGTKPTEAIEAYTNYRRAWRLCRAPGTPLKTRWRAAKLAYRQRRKQRREPVSFKPDDTFLILGAAWDRHGLLNSLRQEKNRVGFAIVVFIHDVIPYFGEEFVSRSAFGNFRAYLQWVDEVADQILCNSNYSKQDLVRTGIVLKADEAIVIPLAHELPVAMPVRNRKMQRLFGEEGPARPRLQAELARWRKKEFVLCVGTIEARKNQLMLVRAWTELSRERVMPLLVLAGKMGHQSEPVRIALERDRPPVVIMENVSDALLIELYQRCAFTVFPSLFEGWGLPVGESLWFGKACLASSATSMPEVGGSHAIYFDPASLSDLKEKITSMLAESKDMRSISRHGLRTWRNVAADIFSAISGAKKIAPNTEHIIETKDADTMAKSHHVQAASGHSVYLGDHTALCRTVFGHKIYVDTRDISLAPHLAMDGKWEMWITEALARSLRLEMNCVDLGTNFGWYTLLMAEKIGHKGKVLGVDANPRMVELCRKSMSVNGFLDRASIYHAAITDQQGDLTFSSLGSDMGSSSLMDMSSTATQFHDQVSTISVSGMRLDDLVADRKIDLIKIDCEGAEPGIIRSGSKTLSNPELQVFMEYAPAFYKTGEAAEMIDTFQHLGFKFFSIETSSNFTEVSRDHLINLTGWSELYLRR